MDLLNETISFMDDAVKNEKVIVNSDMKKQVYIWINYLFIFIIFFSFVLFLFSASGHDDFLRAIHGQRKSG